MSTRREGRLERRALRLLQRSATTGCAGLAATAAATQTETGQTPALSPIAPGVGSSSSATPEPGGSLGAAPGGRGRRGARRPGRSALPPAGTVQRAAAASSFPGAILISALVALLLGLAMIALRESRRRLLPAGGAPDAAARPQRTPPSGHRRTPPAQRLPPPRRPGNKMDSALAAMAADAFAAMSGDADETDPGSQTEGSDPQAHVEGEDCSDATPRPDDETSG